MAYFKVSYIFFNWDSLHGKAEQHGITRKRRLKRSGNLFRKNLQLNGIRQSHLDQKSKKNILNAENSSLVVLRGKKLSVHRHPCNI